MRTEIYPETAKMKKQMSYADSLHIPYVLLVGEEERTTELFTLKNMLTGDQQKLTKEELLRFFA